MAKTKISVNNLVTRAEFRKKIFELEIKIEDVGNALRKDMEEMKKELTDRFFTGWDKIMKELHTIREEQAAHYAAHQRIEERLYKFPRKKS